LLSLSSSLAVLSVVAALGACGGGSNPTPSNPSDGGSGSDATPVEGGSASDGAPSDGHAPSDGSPPSDASHATDAPGDSASGPPLVLDPTQYAQSIAVDATNVYYLGASVFGVPKAGGATFTVATPGAGSGNPHRLLLADGTLYWAGDIPTGGPYKFYSAPVTARDATATLLGATTAGWSAFDLAIDGQRIYAADDCYTVDALPRAGGTLTNLYAGTCNSFEASSLAADPSGGDAFLYDTGKGQVLKVHGADATTAFLPFPSHAYAITVHGASLYFVTGTGQVNEVWSAALDGAGLKKLVGGLPPADGSSNLFVVDGTDAFYVATAPSKGQTLVRVSLASGASQPLYTATKGAPPLVLAFAVDDTYAYLSDPAAGVLRVPR
jgi:hypothetical protein